MLGNLESHRRDDNNGHDHHHHHHHHDRQGVQLPPARNWSAERRQAEVTNQNRRPPLPPLSITSATTTFA